MNKKKFETRGCPQCGIGLLEEKLGKYGRFVGCSRFPLCSYTTDKKQLFLKEKQKPPTFFIHQGHIIENI